MGTFIHRGVICESGSKIMSGPITEDSYDNMQGVVGYFTWFRLEFPVEGQYGYWVPATTFDIERGTAKKRMWLDGWGDAFSF